MVKSSDKSIISAIEAGEKNLKTMELLANWCSHAKVSRSPGRGLIEQQTGLPIGHMGAYCKYSSSESIQTWLLEDAVFVFYQKNCKNCTYRNAVKLPNIMEFIVKRENDIKARDDKIAEQKRLREQAKSKRLEERSILKLSLSNDEINTLNLLDELDNEHIKQDDPRLEELANLAPEVFTRTIIDHLLNSILTTNLPYSTHAARALLKASLQPLERLSVAKFLLNSHIKNDLVIQTILDNNELLISEEFSLILYKFASMAIKDNPATEPLFNERRKLDLQPIQFLYSKRKDDIKIAIKDLINHSDIDRKRAAVKILLAIDNKEWLLNHSRIIFSLLMRQHLLLQEEDEVSESDFVFYLRESAIKIFQFFPSDADELIQKYLADNSEISKIEAVKIYEKAFETNDENNAFLDESQNRAFKRLLWMAIDAPEISNNEAIGFFNRHYFEDIIYKISSEKFDDLVGAATILTQKINELERKPLLELPSSFWDKVAEDNKWRSVTRLQTSLIHLAAKGAKLKGLKGLHDFLNLYHSLPPNQDRMRGNMIAQISFFIFDVESLQAVLPDWYGALLDESIHVRAAAAAAWEHIPYSAIQNVPDLFFETFALLINDPYVYVHQSAVNVLRRKSFPENKRKFITEPLIKLIFIYLNDKKLERFFVECIDVYASLCLKPEALQGKIGKLLSNMLLKLEGDSLYVAVDKLHYKFKNVPDYIKVALKSLQSDYTRSISIDDCISVIFKASNIEIENATEEIEQTLKNLQPYSDRDFHEVLVCINALNKIGKYGKASEFFESFTQILPKEVRNKTFRLEAELILLALKIEESIKSQNDITELLNTWNSLEADLNKEKQNAKSSKFGNFPAGFFL